ncbi:MAG: hypothetical protein LBR73_09345 [Oscillospiraceae bacterium]|jgi:hypothetical protein|nr:hypothetical protein [Oscillospiraceae bacterium]
MRLKSSRILALLLALTLGLLLFASCGTEEEAADTPTSEVIEITEEEPTPLEGEETTTEPVLETTTEAPSTTEAATTTTAAATTEATTAAAKTPDKMTKAELIAWFNECAQNVRTKKPRIEGVTQNQITGFKAGIIPEGIIMGIIKNFMPGDEETWTKNKGDSNDGNFLARQTSYASKLKESDVTSYTVTGGPDTYTVTLNIKDCTNPYPGTGSVYGRIFDFMTPEGLRDDLAGTLDFDPAVCKLNYHSGKVQAKITSDGKVTYSKVTFGCTAVVERAVVAGFLPLPVTAEQSSRVECNIKW